MRAFNFLMSTELMLFKELLSGLNLMQNELGALRKEYIHMWLQFKSSKHPMSDVTWLELIVITS